jgi:hypothetical protein
MIKIVNFTEFRENLANYLEFIYKKGGKVTVTDGRSKKILAKLKSNKKKKDFDWDKHLEWIKNMKPFFTNEDVKAIKRARAATKRRFKELNW